jgi:hypothetical protein
VRRIFVAREGSALSGRDQCCAAGELLEGGTAPALLGFGRRIRKARIAARMMTRMMTKSTGLRPSLFLSDGEFLSGGGTGRAMFDEMPDIWI